MILSKKYRRQCFANLVGSSLLKQEDRAFAEFQRTNSFFKETKMLKPN